MWKNKLEKRHDSRVHTDATARYLETLKTMGLQNEELVEATRVLVKTQVEIEAQKAKNEAIRNKDRLKKNMLLISTVFILIPLIPSINLAAATGAATLGAIGYGTALFEVYGRHAFEAGKSLSDIFNIGR